jgi:hypothetical protein
MIYAKPQLSWGLLLRIRELLGLLGELLQFVEEREATRRRSRGCRRRPARVHHGRVAI